MTTDQTAEQVMDLMRRYISLKPKLIMPEQVAEFRKKMQSFKNSSEDHAFVFRILMLVSQNAEPLTMSALSSELNVPLSTATRIVDGLVQGGMVERVPDPNDRRVVRVQMSQNGRELYELGMAYSKQRIAKLLKNFTAEEQEQLLKLMNKLFDALLNEK